MDVGGAMRIIIPTSKRVGCPLDGQCGQGRARIAIRFAVTRIEGGISCVGISGLDGMLVCSRATEWGFDSNEGGLRR